MKTKDSETFVSETSCAQKAFVDKASMRPIDSLQMKDVKTKRKSARNIISQENKILSKKISGKRRTVFE